MPRTLPSQQALSEPECPWCRYDRTGIDADVLCPECGGPAEELPEPGPRNPALVARYHRRWKVAVTIAAALGLGCIVLLLVLLSGFARAL